MLSCVWFVKLQIEEADFTFPSWFPEGAKNLVMRILVANPKAVSAVFITFTKLS